MTAAPHWTRVAGAQTGARAAPNILIKLIMLSLVHVTYHLIRGVECPPAGGTRNVCGDGGHIPPVEAPEPVPDIDCPRDVVTDLRLGPALRGHRQGVGGHLLGAGPGVEAEHHHVLGHHVKWDDDCLTN